MRKIKRELGLNVLSLFDGMSCGRLALEKANVKINHYVASEIKPFAIKHTQEKFPNTIQIGDVTKVYYHRRSKTLYKNCTREVIDTLANHVGKVAWDDSELQMFKKKHYEVCANGEVYKWTLGEVAFVGKFDLLIGGSPCTQFSSSNYFHNGKMNYGLKGKDSKLFYEYYRIMQEVKPRYFFLENVHMQKASEEALNNFLGVKGIHVNSNIVSIQNRPRIYWTNIKFVKLPKDKGISFQDYKITTLPKFEENIRAQKFDGAEALAITNDEIEEIYNRNLWAYDELVEAYGPMSKREFVGYIHALLMEATPRVTPFATRIWNNGTSKGKFVCKNVTNANKIMCCTTKQARHPNSGLIEFGNFFRYLTKMELCKAQNVPYSFLCDLSKCNLENVIGDGWTIDVCAIFFDVLTRRYDFTPCEEACNEASASSTTPKVEEALAPVLSEETSIAPSCKVASHVAITQEGMCEHPKLRLTTKGLYVAQGKARPNGIFANAPCYYKRYMGRSPIHQPRALHTYPRNP